MPTSAIAERLEAAALRLARERGGVHEAAREIAALAEGDVDAMRQARGGLQRYLLHVRSREAIQRAIRLLNLALLLEDADG